MTRANPPAGESGDREREPAENRAIGRWWHAWTDRLKRRPFVAAWQMVAAVTLTFTVIAGMSVRLTDPERIPTIWDGMWWAIQTVTTVGYGDTVPTSVAGRLLAAGVMMFGIGFLTVTTAAIGTLFSEAARRHRHRDDDLIQQELAHLHIRLDEIATELTLLRAAAVEHTNPPTPPTQPPPP